jgi:hypothetical protein
MNGVVIGLIGGAVAMEALWLLGSWLLSRRRRGW